jgi:rhamnogalacturonan endolyase
MLANLPRIRPLLLASTAAAVLLAPPARAQQKYLEKLNRGVVAVRTNPGEVYVGWRLFGTDPAGIAFNVYRGSTKVNPTPLTGATNFVDQSAADAVYSVRPVVGGVEQAGSATAATWAQPFKRIPLQVPAPGVTLPYRVTNNRVVEDYPNGQAYTYSPNDASVADLDGDGQYEIVLKWDPSNSRDNSLAGYTGNVYIDAYKLDGTRLWRIDLGKNIRAGAHYTQLMVYDLDSDGKAEVAVKTADGTTDGQGTVIGDANADYRVKTAGTSLGYVLSGPEFLTIFNGQTGAAMASAPYLPARGSVSSWGDSYGNRVDRYVAGIAYLDGQRPSLVMGRGYYTRLVRVAWDWSNGQLTQRWIFDSNDPGNGAYAGQGNHQLTVGDVDGDGRDEVCNGASAIDDDGRGLWVNGSGHGDALHLTDMDPSRPGQEVWQCQEEPAKYGSRGGGLQLRDARTGVTLWGVAATTDIGRAMAADIDPRHPGYEVWGSTGGLYTNQGVQIGTTRPSINFGVWWDGDLQRELFESSYSAATDFATVRLDKWNYLANRADRILTPSLPENGGGQTNNTTKANSCITADILGDWREEFVLRSTDNGSLLIYTTTTPTSYRIPTLMHDPQYRAQVALENSAYNQPPNPSFYLGEGMTTPTYNISLVQAAAPAWVGQVAYLAPGNGAAVNADAIRLSWTGAADRYNLLAGTDPNNLQLVAEGLTQPEFILAGATPLGTTYWRVDALRDGDETHDGEVATGAVWSFEARDLVPPTVLTRNITVTLAGGTAQISAADVDNGSSDAYGLASLILDRSTFDCSTIGANVVTLTATDPNGNSASAPATVTVLGTIPQPQISVTPGSNTYTGGVATTLYLGYGPQSLTLTATDGVSYQWSPVAGLSSATAANPTFTATAPGTYAYTVTATSATGCTATASVTLTVVDARCGNKNDKVLVCHHGNLLCIAPSAVPAHLQHGDQLAGCGTAARGGQLSAATAAEQLELTAAPNPVTERATIRFRSAESGAAHVAVYNSLGQLVATLYDAPAEAGQAYTLPLDGRQLPAGLYTCRLSLNGQTQTLRLVVSK